MFEAEVFLFEGDDGGLQFAVTLVDSNGVTGGALQGDEFITRLLFGILQGFNAIFQSVEGLVLVVGSALQALRAALQLVKLLLGFSITALYAGSVHDAVSGYPTVDAVGFDADVIAVFIEKLHRFTGTQGAEEFSIAARFVVHGSAQFVADPGVLRGGHDACGASEG